MEHPNIVRTLDYGQSDADRYYLAIEWAAGEILDKYAEKAGPLPAPKSPASCPRSAAPCKPRTMSTSSIAISSPRM